MADASKESNKDGGSDDEEKMRLAFEAFMLTGKKPASTDKKDDSLLATSSQSAPNKSKKKKKKKKSLGGGAAGTSPKPKPATPSKEVNNNSVAASTGQRTPTQNAATVATPTKSKQSKADRKRYYQLLRSFSDKVQHTWIELDDQMLSVLQNIVSIRGRLPSEWKLLHESLRKNPEADNDDDDDIIGGVEMLNQDDDDWKYHGFLGKPKEVPYSSFHLLTADIQLALSNDLAQHEKMLAGLRSLISNLAECHEGLGRMVDNLWKFHLECTEEEVGEGYGDLNEDDNDGMQDIVDCVTGVFQMLSSELYRKQSMVPLILESTQDEILGIEKQTLGSTSSVGMVNLGAVNSSSNGQNGVQTARECCKSWKRSSDKSCVDESLISHMLRLGDKSLPQQGNKQ